MNDGCNQATVSMTPCALCPLRRTGAFQGNTSDEIAFIERFKHAESLRAAGDVLVEEGKPRGELFTILAGWAFRFRTLSAGGRQILNFLLPGDFVGLQENLGAENVSGVQLLTDARLCWFPADGLWTMYKEFPSLAYDVTWLAAHEELILDENLVSLGQRTAEQRIAMLMIHIFKRAESVGLKGADGSVPFPINQSHLSDALGLSLVHTNKTLRRLANAGLHSIAGGRLRLLNPTALRRVADYYAHPLRGRPLI